MLDRIGQNHSYDDLLDDMEFGIIYAEDLARRGDDEGSLEYWRQLEVNFRDRGVTEHGFNRLEKLATIALKNRSGESDD